MRARLLADFDPGTLTTASSGPVAIGAGQRSAVVAFSVVVIMARLSLAAL
jgi:hypothetical protein